LFSFWAVFRRIFHLILGWFAIWFTVGLFAVAIPYESPVGHFEDFLFMFLAAAVVFLDATRRIGWGNAAAAFLWVALASGVVEMLGALTGVPFGRYEYTDRFGPRLMGVLPWAIPLAWWVVVYPLYLLMARFARERQVSGVIIAMLVGLAAVLVDVALEPVATLVRGYWHWEGGGSYYGVPWQNFLGWFGTAFVIAGVLHYFMGQTLRENYQAAGSLFLPLLVLASVLVSFLGAALAHGLWLAAGWTVFLTLALAVCIIRFAWPRRDVFLLERLGRYQ